MTPSLQNPDMNRTIISKSFGELMNIHELLRKWYDQRSYFLLQYKVRKVQLCIQCNMRWINDFWILKLSGIWLSLTFQTFVNKCIWKKIQTTLKFLSNSSLLFSLASSRHLIFFKRKNALTIFFSAKQPRLPKA